MQPLAAKQHAPVQKVEEAKHHKICGAEVFHLRQLKEEFKGGFSTERLYYQSIWWLTKDAFGSARLTREVCDAWIQKKLTHGGQQVLTEPPPLTEAEIEGVPGGKASLSKLDTLHFEILERSGEKMVIRTDEHKFWISQGGEVTEKYNLLREKHQDLIGRDSTSNTAAEETPPSTGGGEVPRSYWEWAFDSFLKP